jgi:hypothetical protein
MIRGKTLKHGSALLLVSVMLLNILSCGTLLYPERRYAEVGSLDPGVVILDAIGLLFFVVPGIVAFGVDFATGAIYYPKDEVGAVPSSFDPDKTEVVWVEPEELDRETIENVIAQRSDREIDLTGEELRVYELDGNGCFVPRDGSRPVPYSSRTDPKI